MTGTLIPSREKMTAKVAEMTPAAVLAAFCEFISCTQTDTEKITGSTIVENKVGVSKVHAKRSASLLNRIKHGNPVSQNDIIFARKVLVHYRRQLIEMGLID